MGLNFITVDEVKERMRDLFSQEFRVTKMEVPREPR